MAFGVQLIRQAWVRATSREISLPIAVALGGIALLVACINALVALAIPAVRRKVLH